MDPTFSFSQIICRPALESDYPDIAEFCKGIWEGGDYVPDVWHHWLKDPNGILATAEYNGRAIGCAKLTLLAEGQWWLEGFRVDPKHQGLKVGSRLHDYVTNWWLEHGDGAVRLMTSAKNVHVHHLCGKTGFVKTREVCGYIAAPFDEATDSFSLIADIHEAAAFVPASESLGLTDGLIDLGWRICKADDGVFEKYSSNTADFAHTFYWWKDKRGLVSVWEDEEEDRRRLGIGALACGMENMPELLMDVRRLAARRKFDEVFQIAFELPQITSRLEAAGFVKHWEHNAFVFERKHPIRA